MGFFDWGKHKPKSKQPIGFVSSINWKVRSQEVQDIAKDIFGGQYYCIGDEENEPSGTQGS